MIRFWLVVALVLGAFEASADVPLSQRDEVRHLLDFVKNSDCVMERNGGQHPGKKAYSHISRKYEHFKDKISTTEDFIEYAAAKSTMSGKFYKVRCEGLEEMLTRDWLLGELEKYRLNAKKAEDRGQRTDDSKNRVGSGQ